MAIAKKKSSLHRKQTIFVWSSIAPVALFFLAFSFIPIANTFVGSFFDWNALSGRMEYAGLQNYATVFSDKVAKLSLVNTIYFSFFSVAIKTIIGLILALMVHSAAKAQVLYRTVFFLPSICSLLATAFVFRFLFQPDLGTVNGYLAALGIHGPGWLQDPKTAMITVILFTIWKDMGYVFIIFLAGIQGISEDVIEAAVIDGASGFKRIWYIVLPILSPITAYNVATQIIGSLQAYTSIVGLTNTPSGGLMGGPMYSTTTAVVQIYLTAFKDYRFGYGSALAVVLFLVIMIFTAIQMRFQSTKEGI